MPKSNLIRLCVRRSYQFGYLVRTIRTGSEEIMQLLSRKSGRWVRVDPEQIKSDEIPSDCLFPVDELPESSKNGRL